MRIQTRLAAAALFSWAFFFAPVSSGGEVFLEQEILKQSRLSVRQIIRNISPPGTMQGAVIASPSRQNPNYFYHWIRDAAISMDQVVTLYESATIKREKNRYFKLLMNYVHFSRINQLTPNPSQSLGEPKFHVDGSPFTEPLGRPQNDGPALRALTLTRFAACLLDEGKEDVVRAGLYDAKLPTYSVIKDDLEFISHHWREPTFDLWEEIRGHHFYTKMVQRRALIEGALLALRLNDPLAAEWYQKQAKELSVEIEKHWKDDKEILVPTLKPEEVSPYKHSGLDSAVLLAVLHARPRRAEKDTFFSASDDRIMLTIGRLIEVFRGLYRINQSGIPGVAVGRYPEDRYNGTSTEARGNPWPLLTAAVAEYYFYLAKEIADQKQFSLTQRNFTFTRDALPIVKREDIGKTLQRGETEYQQLLTNLEKRGDSFLERVLCHASKSNGFLSEQIDRDHGNPLSAENLTWSYAGFLSAIASRILFFTIPEAEGSPATSKPKETKPVKIGVSFSTLAEERWSREKQLFERFAKELGVTLILQVANGDENTQNAQIENLLTQKVDALIIVPQNGKAVVSAVSSARKEGVPTIAYDRNIASQEVSLYISFDNEKVGEAQAKAIVELAPAGNYLWLGGNPADNNSHLLRKGHMKILKPLVDQKKIKLVSEQWCDDWSPAQALKHSENALTANKNKVDAVIASNDGTAGAAIQALAAQGLAGKVPVSGQDAELAAVQRIVAGTQAVTIFKDITLLAKEAMKAAVQLAKGEMNPRINAKVNGVDAILLDVTAVSKKNVDDVLIQSGFHKRQDVYRYANRKP